MGKVVYIEPKVKYRCCPHCGWEVTHILIVNTEENRKCPRCKCSRYNQFVPAQDIGDLK